MGRHKVSFTAESSTSLRKAFNQAFASGMLAFAAAASLAPAAANAGADATAPVAPATPAAADVYAPDVYDVQIMMQDAARSKFTDLVRAADNGYTARLMRLENRLNDALQRDGAHPRHNAIVILDPAQTDIAVTLEVDMPDVVRSALARRGATAEESRITGISAPMKDSHVTPGGTVTYTQAPMAAMQSAGGTAEACIIIPMPEHDKPVRIKGLTEAEEEDYLNTHEGWHCLDSRYSATAEDKEALGNARTMRDLQQSPAALRALEVINLQEALADVGALGDMIRAGSNPRLLSAVIAWRNTPAENDLEHNTAPALQALAAHINTVGVKAFRAMDEKSAHQLYFRLVDENGLTQPRIQAALDYIYAGGANTPAAIPAPSDTRSAAAAPTTKEAAAAQLQNYYNEKLTRLFTGADGSNLSPVAPGTVERAERLQNRLSQWDARQTLEQTAVRRHGEITLESLVYAYGHLKQGLQKDISAGRDAETGREKLSRLRVELAIIGTRDYDFTAANSRHGVTLRLPQATPEPAATAPAAAAPQEKPAPRR